MVILIFPAISEDIGRFGEMFEIAEPDLMEQIHARLRKLSESGRLKTCQQEVQKRVSEGIKTPRPVGHIKHTETPRTFEYDPTIVITSDLKDQNVEIFAKKGERFNPLDRISMTKPLLFIDGNEESHRMGEIWSNLHLAHV